MTDTFTLRPTKGKKFVQASVNFIVDDTKPADFGLKQFLIMNIVLSSSYKCLNRCLD